MSKFHSAWLEPENPPDIELPKVPKVEEWNSRIIQIRRPDGQLDEWMVLESADGKVFKFWAIKDN